MKFKTILLLVFFFLLVTPSFAQQTPPDNPPNNDDQDSCSSSDESFEALILVIHDTLEERKQDQVGSPGQSGDQSKDPHLFLPPFEALFGIGSGVAISVDFVSQFIPPLPFPAPPTVEVDNPTLFGLSNACETIETSSDPN